jgi:hypothetical protein
MSQAKLQFLIVTVIVILWIVAVCIAAFDGNDLLKIVTPIATMAFGWLFADKAVSS